MEELTIVDFLIMNCVVLIKKLTGIAEIELFIRPASTCQYTQTLLTNLNTNLNLYPQAKDVSYKKCILFIG